MASGDPLSTNDPATTEDPLPWGYSLTNVREILLGCLDAAGVRTLLEIGAFKGELTSDLLGWAASSGARVTSIDTVPPQELLELSRAHPELELLQETSHEVLRRIQSLPDAIVIDGDHNYFTLSEELRLIDEKAGTAPLPLLLFHDVCWPHARRDTYYEPGRIPDDQRQPLGHNVGLSPDEPGTDESGLPFIWAAAREGGPRNGTLTAIEDFMSGREGLRFAVVPAFFGFGILWSERAPWASSVAELLAPLDRNPVLERLEAHRVRHLVAGQGRALEIGALREQNMRQQEVLRKLLASSAFALAERLSALRQRGEPAFSREEVRRVLGSG